MKNKALNRRALAVYLVVCLLYVSVAFRIPEKLSMKRIAVRPDAPSRDMNIQGSFESAGTEPHPRGATEEKPPVPVDAHATVPEAPSAEITTAAPAKSPTPGRPTPEKPSQVVVAPVGPEVEPRFFISVPITCYAIKEGWVDKETLVFSKKDGQQSIWLKPLDILKQHDEDGMKGILNIIGKNRLKELLKKEGIDIRHNLSPEEIILGRGYLIEKKKLLSLYTRFVSDECNDLFPLVLAQGGVVKGKQGFQFVSAAEAARGRTGQEESEWRMPNLEGLPIKVAIDKLAAHTSRIKVHGSGFVADQSPKAFERLKGNSECAIYGRLHSE
jgi:hypothetical protein